MHQTYNKNMTNKYEITNQGDDEPTNQHNAVDADQQISTTKQTPANKSVQSNRPQSKRIAFQQSLYKQP